MLIRIIGALELAVLLMPVSTAFAVDPPQPEVLARGPIHEAYAEPVDQAPAAGAVIPLQPPAQIEEMPPEQKPAGEHVVWLPGYWSYDEERKDYIWISGFWRALPPGKAWAPGSWHKVDAGWQWVGGFWGNAQEQHEVHYLPQPPATAEAGPVTPAPTATAIYVPGCWVWKDRYFWRPGYWVEQRPNWIFVPAHYRWTPAGYVYIDGYWDYTLADRGILYAPAYIPRAIYLQASYRYSPTIVVREQCVMGALFVRRGGCCYYFGDYFDPRYSTQGYVSWCGYSRGAEVVVVRGWYDPMYSYYRVSYRNDPAWNRDMVSLYVGRYRGEIAPPPRTLALQNAVVVKANINIGNVQMLTTVNLMAKANPAMKFQTLTVVERQEHLRSAREIIATGNRRNQLEVQLIARNVGVAHNAPRVVKVDMPRTMVGASAAHAERIGVKPGLAHDPHQAPPLKKPLERERERDR
jgi:hypothetical protein